MTIREDFAGRGRRGRGPAPWQRRPMAWLAGGWLVLVALAVAAAII